MAHPESRANALHNSKAQARYLSYVLHEIISSQYPVVTLTRFLIDIKASQTNLWQPDSGHQYPWIAIISECDNRASLWLAGLTRRPNWLERWGFRLSVCYQPWFESLPGPCIGHSSTGLSKFRYIDSSFTADCFSVSGLVWMVSYQGSTLSPWQHVSVGHVVSQFYVPWHNFYVPDKITTYFPSHNFALTIKWAIFGEMSKHLRSVVSTTFSIGWGWIHNKCYVLLNSTKMSNVLHWYASIWTKFLTHR